jgi:hypothetical protein
LSRAGIAAAVVAIGAAAGCGSTKTVTRTVTVNAAAKRGVGAPREQVLFGYIKALTKKGNTYTLKFDPAWFLSGETANDAAATDGLIPRGQPVPNDNYVVNENKRAFTYRVAPDARVTILTRAPNSTPSTVRELAAIVNGTSTRKLFEPISTGFWIRADIDTVTSLDQQYRP